MSGRDYADKAIDGGADRRFRISLAGRLGEANELLNRASIKLRDALETEIECGCILTKDDDPVPAKIAENRDVIEEVVDEIELIREIEEHLGGCAWPGPAWLDEIIAQGPDWAGGSS